LPGAGGRRCGERREDLAAGRRGARGEADEPAEADPAVGVAALLVPAPALRRAPEDAAAVPRLVLEVGGVAAPAVPRQGALTPNAHSRPAVSCFVQTPFSSA